MSRWVETPDIVVHVWLGRQDVESEWEYELRFSQDKRQQPVVKQERVVRRGEEILFRPLEEDKRDPARLTQTYLEQINANQAFREISDFFASVRYLHLVPQLVRDPGRSSGRRNDPYGGDFRKQVGRTSELRSRIGFMPLPSAEYRFWLEVSTPD